MDQRIIDCCSLINLYTGWGDLVELGSLGGAWYVGDVVLDGEAQHTRESDSEGNIVTIPIDLRKFEKSGTIQRANIQGSEELELYVNLAQELDDGEAQALAIAKSRGLTILTDDAKAKRKASELSVPVTTTAQVLRAWVESGEVKDTRVREVLRRISNLARFTPSPSDPAYEWWRARVA